MALKDKLMTLEDFKAVRDVDVASNSAQFTELRADLSAKGLSAAAKSALLAFCRNVAFYDTDEGEALYQDLYDALNNTEIASISAAFTQGSNVFYTFDSLDSLKACLVVTAHYDNGATEALTDYTLSGTLAVGTSTITVTYETFSTTFSVTVSALQMVNNSTFGATRDTTTNIYYALPAATEARARFSTPIRNKSYTFTVIDTSKYNITGYDCTSDVLTEFHYNSTTYEGYPTEKTGQVQWGTSHEATADYIALAFKKMDGTNFTDAEISGIVGTVITVSEG